jgi:hypothetical protein
MEKNGFGVEYKPSEAFADFLAQSDEVMGQLMREAGIVK